MSFNPLSYESLKTVIQYMEANIRYQLSCQIPAIRTAEKVTPLKFESLEFNRLRTRVNLITYRLSVYRQYHNGLIVPKDHETRNANGGINRDLVDNGFESLKFTDDITPGDVYIHYPSREFCPWLQDTVFNQRQYFYERHIEIYEKAVTMKLEQSADLSIARGGGKATVSPRFVREIVDPTANQRAERELLEVILPLSVEQLQEKISDFNACLIPYHCRRDNTSLPFIPLIQLTVESPTGVSIYRHINMKLSQVMKKVNTALFGGRNYILNSRSLNITEPLIVIRMPEGVRMRIRELQVAGDVASNYKALNLIVEEASYPLNSLTITDRLLDESQYQPSIIGSAKTLSIKSNHRILRSCLPFLCSLKNETIHVDCILWRFPLEDQTKLVEHWLNTDKDIGNSLSYDIKGLEVVAELLSQISLRFIGVRQTHNMVVMPMKNGNHLEVSYASTSQPDSQNEHQEFRVDMKVIATDNCHAYDEASQEYYKILSQSFLVGHRTVDTTMLPIYANIMEGCQAIREYKFGPNL